MWKHDITYTKIKKKKRKKNKERRLYCVAAVKIILIYFQRYHPQKMVNNDK